jgi:DNA-binding response OmpR family regulator
VLAFDQALTIMTKPFDWQLAARIAAVLRRSQARNQACDTRVGDAIVDFERGGDPPWRVGAQLTTLEFKPCGILCGRRGESCRDQLIDGAWVRGRSS